jgi:hypothetical protein
MHILARLDRHPLVEQLNTSGVRVEPPTSSTASMSPGFLPESCSALETLSSVDSTRGRISAS